MTLKLIRIAGVALVAMSMACSNANDVEKVPVGTDVQLTTQDGGVVEGKLTGKDATVVKVSTGRTTKEVPRTEIADVRVVDGKKPVELPAIAKFREYTVPEGTPLRLTMETAVSSETANVEDAITATLADPVRIDGAEVLPAGSIVRGNVYAAESAGKVKGRASLGLEFTTIIARDERYPISVRWSAQAESTKKQDATKIGIGAGAGAVIGAILGGKKGAATGAVVGGGAGTVMVLTSEGKPIVLGKGEALTVKLANPIDVRVPVR